MHPKYPVASVSWMVIMLPFTVLVEDVQFPGGNVPGVGCQSAGSAKRYPST